MQTSRYRFTTHERSTATSASVISVNISGLRPMQWNGQQIETGIYKTAVTGLVAVERLHLHGDRQADLRVHGGPLKAIYCYPSEHYPFWSEEIGIDPLPPGALGENLTTRGLLESDLHIGDRLRVGTAILQVTQPRSPCFKLAQKFNRPGLVAKFMHAARPGWYASVVSEGTVTAGDAITLIASDPLAVSIADIWRLSTHRDPERELRTRALQLPTLPDFWREQIAAHLG